MEIITSRTNPLCTHLRKLASSVSYRRDCGSSFATAPSCWRRLCCGERACGQWSARTPPPCLPCPILSAASRYPGI
ncbi:MAG: hypothetical protein ACLTYN_16460 [Dysosmobacter welbionis]